MNAYNIGDKVRILNVEAIDFGRLYWDNGDVTEVVSYFHEDTTKPRLRALKRDPDTGDSLYVDLHTEGHAIEKVETEAEPMFKAGDKVRLIDVERIMFGTLVGGNGTITEVLSAHLDHDTPHIKVQSQSGGPFIITEDEFNGIQNITARPSEATTIAMLKAKVEALEERMAMYEDQVTEPAQKTTFGCDLGALPVGFCPPPKPTPNAERADVIKQAKAFVKDAEDQGKGTASISHKGNNTYNRKKYVVEYHVNEDKRAVTVLVKTVDLVGVKQNEVIEKATAKCAADDVFNADIGKAIALSRALGLDTPDEFIDAPQPSELAIGMAFVSQMGLKGTITEFIPSYDYAGHGRAFRHTHDGGWLGEGQVEIVADTNAQY